LGNITQVADEIAIGDNAFASVPAGGEIWATQKQVAQDFLDAVHEKKFSLIKSLNYQHHKRLNY
jgi:hypothetical protein